MYLSDVVVPSMSSTMQAGNLTRASVDRVRLLAVS